MISTQKLLPIRAELRLPTLDMTGARAVLGEDEEAVKELVYDQLKLPAWNIARVIAPGAGTKDDPHSRRELRILAVACRNHAEGKSLEYDDDLIVRRIYGAPRLLLKGTWFSASWNCDPGHVINLLRDKTLIAEGGWSQGRNGTPSITWASAVAFLKSRRIK